MEEQGTKNVAKMYLTVPEVAAMLSVSQTVVIQHFSTMEGVIDLGTPSAMNKRRKRMLRIPPRVVDAFIADRAAATVRSRRR